MALTQISTAGVKDDAVTSGKIPANAVGSSELADNAVDTAAIADDAVTTAKINGNAVGSNELADGAVTNGKLGSEVVTNIKVADNAINEQKLQVSNSPSNGYFLSAQSGNTGGLTWAQVTTDLVGDSSPQLGGDLASNSNDIVMADNDQIKLGASNDFTMFHDSSGHTFLQDQGTGALRLRSNSEVAIQKWDGSTNENMAIFSPDAQVELYHNGSKRFSTSAQGFNLKEGDTTRLSFTYSSGLAFITANAGNEIKVSSGNGIDNGIEFWDYSGVTKRCQIDGHGIKFGADTAETNALDDYEEGTWTPDLRFGGGSSGMSYSSNSRNGEYTKIGNLVTFTFRFTLTNKGSSTGNALVYGLPFNCANGQGNYSGASFGYLGGLTNSSRWSAHQTPTIDTNTDYVFFRYVITGTDYSVNHNDASFTNGTDVIARGFYYVS